MFRAAPWADALFAHDEPWWRIYADEVRKSFAGMCVSMARVPGVRRAWFESHANSGTGALMLAASMGAERIVMVGYDCQHTGGRAHSHGDHPPTLGNAGSVKEWPARFAACAQYLSRRRIEVINATRETALTCFPRNTLESALA